jgi:hypothetical protein
VGKYILSFFCNGNSDVFAGISRDTAPLMNSAMVVTLMESVTKILLPLPYVRPENAKRSRPTRLCFDQNSQYCISGVSGTSPLLLTLCQSGKQPPFEFQLLVTIMFAARV